MKIFENKKEVTMEEIKVALDFATKQVKNNLPEFTNSCQNHSSVNNFYTQCENDQWTCGFWPGEVWLSYEYTKDEEYRKSGDVLVENFLDRIERKVVVDHHDMGFLYTPSCISAYKLTGNENAKKASILAADNLLRRFHEKGNFLQAWGALFAEDNYRYIIDCLLNLPLLYWATEATGDSKYADIAHKHITTCLKYSIREDGSTHHTVFMNKEDGSFSHGSTCQGYDDNSSWARGQAWAIYGVALSYVYSKKSEYIETFERVLNYYLSKLPKDLIPFWDMIFTDGDDEPRDSSSASIVICGLLEMSKHVDKEKSEYYTSIAKKMLKSLIDDYSVKDSKVSNGLVLHATYCKKTPYNTCVPKGEDECCSWGDYFYMEALIRLYFENWEMYW